MAPYTRDQRKESVEHPRPSHRQRRHGTGTDTREDPQEYDEDVTTIARRGSNSGEKTPDKDTNSVKDQQGLLSRYGAFVLFAGLGFGAGFLYSNNKKSTGRGRHRDRPRSHYAHEDCDEGYQDRARLEYRRPDDRLSHRAESVRGSLGNGHWLNDNDEYGHWR